jgi:hypothetical protein
LAIDNVGDRFIGLPCVGAIAASIDPKSSTQVEAATEDFAKRRDDFFNRFVSPRDWTYQTFLEEAEKFGCTLNSITSDANKQQIIMRDEFALDLIACLDRIKEMISNGEIDSKTFPKDRFKPIQRLQEEFAAELTSFRAFIRSNSGLQALSPIVANGAAETRRKTN